MQWGTPGQYLYLLGHIFLGDMFTVTGASPNKGSRSEYLVQAIELLLTISVLLALHPSW